MLFFIMIFVVVYSGMVSLWESGEKMVGERVYRVLFVGILLFLVVIIIVSFWCFFFKGSYILMINKFYCVLYSFYIFLGMFYKLSVWWYLIMVSLGNYWYLWVFLVFVVYFVFFFVFIYF